MVHAIVDCRRGALGMTPVRTMDPDPPLRVVVERDGLVGRLKHHRAGLKQRRLGLWSSRWDLLLQLFPVDRALGDRAIPRSLHEGGELRIGHLMAADSKRLESYSMSGELIGPRLRTHTTLREFAGSHRDQIEPAWVRVVFERKNSRQGESRAAKQRRCEREKHCHTL